MAEFWEMGDDAFIGRKGAGKITTGKQGGSGGAWMGMGGG